MITQLWLFWHGQHSKIRYNTNIRRDWYGTNYECLVCGAEKKDRKRKQYDRKHSKDTW